MSNPYQFEQELAPFFGNDGRSRLFTTIFIEPTNYDNAINDPDAESIVNNTLATDVMLAEKHENLDTGMNFRDVHYDFTDFLIQVGLFHRSIDEITDFPRLSRDVMDALKKDVTDFSVGTSVLGNVSGDCLVFGETWNLPGSIDELGETNTTVCPTLSQVEKILYRIVGYQYVQKTGSHTFNADPDWPGFSSLDKISKILTNKILASAAFQKVLAEFDTEFSPTGTTVAKDKIKTELPKNLEDGIKKTVNRYFAPNATPLDANGFKTKITNNMDDFKDSVVRIITDTIKSILDGLTPKRSSFGTKTGTDLWENVFNKWSSLAPNSQKFYKKHLKFMKDDTPLDPEKGGYDASSASRFRINLIKHSMTSRDDRVPHFIDLIPLYPKDKFTGIWYTDKNGTHKRLDNSTTTALPDFLRDQYRKAVLNERMLDFPTEWKPAGDFTFQMDYDRLIRERLYALKNEMKKPSIKPGEIFSLTDRNVWHRDEQGRLYTMDGNEKVYYEKDSPATQKVLNKNYNCYSSFVKASPTDCNMFMSECIMNQNLDDVSKCIQYWKRHDFYTTSKEDISKMHPDMAIAILHRFKFLMTEVTDPLSGKRLNKMMSRDAWIKNVLDSQFDAATQQVIKSNDKLLDYLQLLVEYINASPQILNPGFTGKTEEMIGTPSRSPLAVGLNIPLRKEPLSGYSRELYEAELLRNNLASRGLMIQTPLSYSSPFSGRQFGFFGQGFQGGGQGLNVSEYLQNIKEGRCGGSSLIEAGINRLLSDLKSMGQQVDKDMSDSITKKLTELRKLEVELVKTEMYLEEYKRLLYIFNDKDPETITLERIQKFIELCSRLYSRKNREEVELGQTYNYLTKLKHGCAKLEDKPSYSCGKQEDNSSYKEIEY